MPGLPRQRTVVKLVFLQNSIDPSSRNFLLLPLTQNAWPATEPVAICWLREPEYKIQRQSVPLARGFGRRYRPEPREFMRM